MSRVTIQFLVIMKPTNVILMHPVLVEENVRVVTVDEKRFLVNYVHHAYG